jgi:chemotaxis protein CheC
MVQLDDVKQDVLREIGNIGLGNAITALSELDGQSYLITVPEVSQIELSEVPFLFGDPERIVVGAAALVTGDWGGHAAFMFPWESATALWTRLLGESPEDINALELIHTSTISEVANIMSGAYLTAISTMTGFELMLEPPAFVADMSAAILSSLTVEALLFDREMIAIRLQFLTPNDDFEGFFLYLPELGGLNKLFAALGVN